MDRSLGGRCFQFLVRVAALKMRIQVNTSSLRQTRWYQVVVRFCLGGLITAAAGIIAKEYGPGVGGLFLAFPAIFPASVTLIEKHEREKKEKAGLHGAARARKAASVDATGAAMGSIGLLLFAFLISRYVTDFKPWTVMLGATVAWMGAAALLWHIRKHGWRSIRLLHRRRDARRPPIS